MNYTCIIHWCPLILNKSEQLIATGLVESVIGLVGTDTLT